MAQKKNSETSNSISMKSPNMNYRYNVEYFKDINIIKSDKEESYTLVKNDTSLSDWNREILKFNFKKQTEYFKDINTKSSFSLVTSYPGLLIGIGNEHKINAKETFKVGFTFDYVTGIPYIPGSSLKGLLRSYFPDLSYEKPTEEKNEKNEGLKQFINCCLEKDELDVIAIQQLKENIFDNNDVFLGAYPIMENDTPILEEEFITPHKNELKNPIPINLIKVKPEIKFEFYFILTDFEKDGKVLITKEEKLKLFKNIILNCGAGARTNVGFGRFEEIQK